MVAMTSSLRGQAGAPVLLRVSENDSVSVFRSIFQQHLYQAQRAQSWRTGWRQKHNNAIFLIVQVRRCETESLAWSLEYL